MLGWWWCGVERVSPVSYHVRWASAADKLTCWDCLGVLAGQLQHFMKSSVDLPLMCCAVGPVPLCRHLQLVKALPLDRLVLETDAPALGPHKDIDNVPANIVVSAREIARIKGLSLEQVVHITTENAYKLFPRLS